MSCNICGKIMGWHFVCDYDPTYNCICGCTREQLLLAMKCFEKIVLKEKIFSSKNADEIIFGYFWNRDWCVNNPGRMFPIDSNKYFTECSTNVSERANYFEAKSKEYDELLTLCATTIVNENLDLFGLKCMVAKMGDKTASFRKISDFKVGQFVIVWVGPQRITWKRSWKQHDEELQLCGKFVKIVGIRMLSKNERKIGTICGTLAFSLEYNNKIIEWLDWRNLIPI